MNTNTKPKVEAWAVIELFDHTVIAGYVSEFVFGGASFVRVDVPASDEAAAFTKVYGPAAIYSITFVDEDTAIRAVSAINPRPISIYIPSAVPAPEHARLRAPTVDDDFDDDYDSYQVRESKENTPQ